MSVRQRAVLMVEDQLVITLDLERAIMNGGGFPVGPATTVSGALRLLNVERVNGAILDVDLRGEDVTPVVEALLDRGIPFVFHTGVGLPPELYQRCPGTPIHTKPVAAEVLIGSLGALLAQGEERPAAA